MRLENDPDPNRTRKVLAFFVAASKGRFDQGAVAERSIGTYPVERLQRSVQGITALTFIACQKTAGRRSPYGETDVFLQSRRSAADVLGDRLHPSGRIAFVIPEV
jgi:hypothetical protein